MAKNVTIEARVELESLAYMARYLQSIGMPATSKSDLVYKSLKVAVHAALKSSQEDIFRSTEEALQYLERIGLSSFTSRSKIVVAALQKEALDADGFSMAYGDRRQIKREHLSDEEIYEMTRVALENQRAIERQQAIRQKSEGLADTDLPPAQRASLTAEADMEQKERMKEFISSLKQPGQSPEEGE